MRRRLVVAIVGSVAAALVLAGLGTLVLAGVGARRYTEHELRSQVEDITGSLAGSEPLLPAGADRPRLLAALRAALRLEGVGLLVATGGGELVGELPDGVALSAAEEAALAEGDTVSGQAGRLVYAAAPFERGGTTTVVVLSDRTALALGGSVLWFLLAAAGVLALAVVVATRLSAALTRPIVQAQETSHRLAAGDLTARVPEPPPEARDEVADLARSVNAMAAALERSRRLDQQFLLSVSHDLRTPLTSIRGYAEALADGTTGDAARAGSVILAESRRLDRLVRDLLELGRLDARLFSLAPEPVELDELVAACVEGFGPEAEAAGVAVDVGTEPVVVRGDPDRLAQVVANLLENALRYAAGRVVVSVRRDPATGRAVVRVDDDGPGMAEADRPHVFERLYVSRHDPERRESGSGLGLAIVRELVVAMGGTVGVDASPTGGARLWFDLPA